MIQIKRLAGIVFASAMLAFSAFAEAATALFLKASESLAPLATVEKLESELEQSKSLKVTDNKRKTNIGCESGGSPLGFVQMLTAINGRSNASFA